ncbi:hypothetical protein EKO27_g1889 [Xylaria grammica]|uniref:Uncharacterized protein n=1 Tax=Xylaria grammica TaxID=363999 RepID=A0A439DFL7_9PEZI|nr:hypothetical protein EKO27_g1889 [Xylaria grammica]
MTESVSGAVPNVLTNCYLANGDAAFGTTATPRNDEGFPTSRSETPTEPPFDPTTVSREALVSAVQSSHQARLETPFSPGNLFEPATNRDPDTTSSSTRISQATVQGGPDESPIPNLKLPLGQSLGILSCVTIFGGSALTLLAVAFLVFLWAGGGPVEGGTQAQPAWRNIMLHGWATQSVTLTSLFIRVISSAQAGLCTSMVAALLLERRGVPISKVVQLSVTRSVNVGPAEFLYMITSQKVRRVALKVEVILLFILAVNTAFGIQFSTTILISDFGTTRLVRNSNRTIINVAMSPTSIQRPGPLSTFGDGDSSTILFGEADSYADPAPNQLGVSDTGTKQRAFLPFQREDRVGLQYFSGAAFSMVSRAACIRPSMTARLSFIPGGWPFIEGTINYNQSLEDAGRSPTQRCYTAPGNHHYCLPTTFNCSLPGSSAPLPDPQWATAICHLQIDLDSDSMPGWDQNGSLFDFRSGSWPHLVFATNIPSSDWKQLEQSGRAALRQPVSYGEWVSNEIEPGKFLNTTFFFSVIYATVSSLTMTGNINQTGPALSWNTTTGLPKIGSVQTLFGADHMHKTPAERGIVSIVGDIRDPAPLSAFNTNTTLAQDTIDYGAVSFGAGAAAGVWENIGNASVSMCVQCDIRGYSVPDDVAALFQRIINTTGRASIAIDTYLAVLSLWWYYYLFPRFNVPGYVDVAFVADVLLPIRWRGLTAVLVLVGMNTVVMWIIAALYVRRTRFSRAGNYWHAVAQLISEDTIPLLEKSGEIKDEDLTEQLDLESEDFLVKLECSV